MTLSRWEVAPTLRQIIIKHRNQSSNKKPQECHVNTAVGIRILPCYHPSASKELIKGYQT